MKRMLVVLAGLMAVSMWTFAANAPTEPKKIETKQGAVTFNHKAHADAGAKCADCHHKNADKPAACSTCHTKEAKDKQPNLFNAIHGKGQFSCKACHEKEAAAGKKTPKACADCHKK